LESWLIGLAVVFAGKGQDSNMPRALDRLGQVTLVLGAGTGLAARADLTFFGDKAAQQRSACSPCADSYPRRTGKSWGALRIGAKKSAHYHSYFDQTLNFTP
jgi:hypothetical protein